MKKLMIKLKHILNDDFTKDIYKYFLEYNKKSPKFSKNWIGFNYSSNEVESIKIYFTFYDLNNEVILSNFNLKMNQEYLKLIKNISKDALIVKSYGSGITFSIKINQDDSFTYGWYFRINNVDNEKFVSINGKINLIKSKGRYIQIHNNNILFKDYYYIDANKSIGIKDYVGININNTILEYSKGNSSSDNSNTSEKIVIIGNYDNVISEFSNLHSNSMYKKIKTIAYKRKTHIYCPGFSLNTKSNSLYLFSKTKKLNQIDTIENFIQHDI